MWAFAHAQKINIPVSMVTAADTPIFRVFFIEFPCRIIEVPDNGVPDNRGSTVFVFHIMGFLFCRSYSNGRYSSENHNHVWTLGCWTLLHAGSHRSYLHFHLLPLQYHIPKEKVIGCSNRISCPYNYIFYTQDCSLDESQSELFHLTGCSPRLWYHLCLFHPYNKSSSLQNQMLCKCLLSYSPHSPPTLPHTDSPISPIIPHSPPFIPTLPHYPPHWLYPFHPHYPPLSPLFTFSCMVFYTHAGANLDCNAWRHACIWCRDSQAVPSGTHLQEPLS